MTSGRTLGRANSSFISKGYLLGRIRGRAGVPSLKFVLKLAIIRSNFFFSKMPMASSVFGGVFFILLMFSCGLFFGMSNFALDNFLISISFTGSLRLRSGLE
jgi:hypothetical protein